MDFDEKYKDYTHTFLVNEINNNRKLESKEQKDRLEDEPDGPDVTGCNGVT